MMCSQFEINDCIPTFCNKITDSKSIFHANRLESLNSYIKENIQNHRLHLISSTREYIMHGTIKAQH